MSGLPAESDSDGTGVVRPAVNEVPQSTQLGNGRQSRRGTVNGSHGIALPTCHDRTRNRYSAYRLRSAVEQGSNLFGVFPVHQMCEGPRADPVLSDNAARRPGSWDWLSIMFNETR